MNEVPDCTGWIAEHREVASQKIGRPLIPGIDGECVHHIDEDRYNNDPDNLMVFRSVSDHTKFHQGGTLIPLGDGTFATQSGHPDKLCAGCNTPILGRAWCLPCYKVDKAKRIPAKEVLETLIWEVPAMEIAKRYGVSSVAVKKWCKKYDIETPTRGYWQKLRAAQSSA